MEMNQKNVYSMQILLLFFFFILRKQNKKHKILKETVSVQDQLEMYKNQLEELEKKNSILTGDLICMKRSPSNQGDPSETQGFGPRAKHLKQLKIQHNKLTNVKLFLF